MTQGTRHVRNMRHIIIHRYQRRQDFQRDISSAQIISSRAAPGAWVTSTRLYLNMIIARILEYDMHASPLLLRVL